MTLCVPRSALVGAAVLLAWAGQAVEPTRILIPETATPAVRAAASEFAKYYREVTGRTLVTSVSRGNAVSAVRIGFPEAFGGDCDAYAIRSEGDDLVLAGRNGRSVLYAVYDFFARRAGCRWFWDGDVVPKRDRIDFSGLDVKEASRFRYRGCQYFPHRGLTRFQAEHWGFEDWAREIDWALKNRLNFLMPRHGIGDLFQRAFPESVPYPDPSVTQATDCKPGHNTRSPFWSLQFRSMLHKAVVGYMSEREMLYPVEFGTLTHWFSRTPQEFLETEKPTFMPQVGNLYGEDSGRVWNVLDPKWFDAYWRLSEASAATYGDKGIWFTPGFDERLCYTNRADNLRLKKKMIVDYVAKLHGTRPDAQALVEGWDIHFAWKPEEVKAMLPELDPARTTIFDFTADAKFNKNEFVPMGNNFTLWGVTNSFPYTFGFMLAFNRGNDIRADYGVIRERQKAITNDPMCRGYLLWPECSHSDIFAWRYFTANCWNPSEKDVPELLHEFCADRYGRDAAAFEAIWRDVIPFSSCQDWGGMYPYFLTHELRTQWNDRTKWLGYGTPKGLENAGRIFRALAAIRWEGTFVRRDTIDLARTTGDRLLTDALALLLKAYHAQDVAELERQARRCRALSEALADTLALHEDYSLNASLDRLDRIERIRNPDFEHVLFDNAADYYSRSHHAELAKHWYVPETAETCEILLARMKQGDRSPLPEGVTRRFEELRTLAHPIRALAVSVPRTPENYRRTMERFAEAVCAAPPAVCAKETSGFPVPPSWNTFLTREGAFPKRNGHVQGMCVTKDALYMTLHTGLYKFDWKGNLIAKAAADKHTGDICWWNGRLYTAMCAPLGSKQTGQGGRLCMYDENLNLILQKKTVRGADGIVCVNGVLYVGLGPNDDPKNPYRGNWYGKFDARTLEPVCEPFFVDHGYDVSAGVQNMATDGERLYVNFYTPQEGTPRFFVFDLDFKVLGHHVFGYDHGFDLVGGGKDGAVRFVWVESVGWMDREALPQALVNFAELKDGEIRDISRHIVFSRENPR